MVNTQSDRSKCPPWGLEGGGDAAGNAIALRIGGQWKTHFPNAKVLVAQLKTDDAWRVSSGGGGGYGSPFDRPVEKVREDVYQGYVSVKAAAELYGVVIDPESFEINKPRLSNGDFALRIWRKSARLNDRGNLTA